MLTLIIISLVCVVIWNKRISYELKWTLFFPLISILLVAEGYVAKLYFSPNVNDHVEFLFDFGVIQKILSVLK